MRKFTTYSAITLMGILLGQVNYSNAQNISINTTGVTPNGSAILDLNTGNTWTSPNGKGLLIPCMSTADMSAITSPATGLYIYNTDCNVFDYWNGTAWISFPSSSLATPGPITGLTAVCQGATGVTYSVPTVTGATTYAWTVPTGATISGPSNGTSISVDFGTNSGNVCVSAVNNCGTGSAYCTTVYTGATPSIVATANPATICSGSSSTLTASGASSYTWAPTSSLSASNGSSVTASPTITTTYTVTGTTGTCTSTQTITVSLGTSSYWTQLNPTSPPSGRQSMAMVWDNTDNEMIMFAGAAGLGSPTYDNDLWTYSPTSNTWTHITTAVGGPPSATYLEYSVWDPIEKEMLVFGGGQALQNTLWAYSPSLNTWTSLLAGPGAREQGSTVWDAADNLMIICGGYNGSRLNDLHAYSPTGGTWTTLTPPGPLPGVRDGNSAVWDAVNNRMLMFGGYSGTGTTFYNDLWAYSPSANTWTLLTPTGGPPATRENQCFVINPTTNVVYMYGGDANGTYFSDLWTYTISTNTWAQVTYTCGATINPTCSGGIWDQTTNQMLLFGGCTNTAELNTFWQYTP